VALDRKQLRSQRLREVNFQGDALRLGMNWTEEDSEESMRTVRDFAAREVVRVLTGMAPLSPVNAWELATAAAGG